MENNLKLMKPHTDDLTSFDKRFNISTNDNNLMLNYRNECVYNYFGINSGLNYNDCEREVFWEF